jgi:DNA-binding transcriptional LysR family regulator
MKKSSKDYEKKARRMATPTRMHLVDLNLFRVFDALMLHRSVRKTSELLMVTPSAVSHALNRLRDAIGDPLFTPSRHGMEPTQRALELASAVRKGLANFEVAFSAKPFVPSEAVRTFRLAASDFTSVVVLPQLVKRLAKSAPYFDLRIFPLGRLDLVGQIEMQQVDLAIGWFGALPRGMRRRTLFQEEEAFIVRVGHPLTQCELTKERLFEFAHVVVELTGTEEHAADGFFYEKGVARRVWIERALLELQDEKIDLVGRAAVCVSHFAVVPPLLEATDMIATVPRRLALRAVQHFPLVMLDPPYTPLSVDIEVVWQESADRDQALQWLLNELTESIRAVNSAS